MPSGTATAPQPPDADVGYSYLVTQTFPMVVSCSSLVRTACAVSSFLIITGPAAEFSNWSVNSFVRPVEPFCVSTIVMPLDVGVHADTPASRPVDVNEAPVTSAAST